MRKNRYVLLAVFALIFLFSSKTAAKTIEWPFAKRWARSNTLVLVQGYGLDFQAEGGIVLNDIGQWSQRFFFRERIGLIYLYDPWYFAVGAILEGTGLPNLAAGIQAEVLHMSGYWAEAGISGGEEGGFIHISVGWFIGGFEWQRRVIGDSEELNAFLLKLKLPLGAILMGI